MRKIRTAAAVAACGLWLLAAASELLAQDGDGVRRGPLELARYCPASAELFISIQSLAEVDNALTRAHAWRFLPLLSGDATDEKIRPPSLLTFLRDFVGDSTELPFQVIQSAQLAMTVPSLNRLDSAVWLARSNDPAAFDQLGHRLGDRPAAQGAARFFSTRNGLLVTVRDGVAAMARRSAGRASLSDTMMLMAGREVPSLFDDAQFQSLFSYLPGRALAMAYVRTDSSAPGGITAGRLDVDRLAVGMYEGDGLLNFAMRATTRFADEQVEISGDAIRRLALLPRTTLIGAVFRIGESTHAQPGAGGSSRVIQRAKTLLLGLRDPDRLKTPFPPVNPHVVIAWDQDLRPNRSSPQVALLVQSRRPADVQREVGRIVLNALKIITALSPGTAPIQHTIQRTVHLGTRIYTVRFQGEAGVATHPVQAMLSRLEPSWAVFGNWFVFGLSADHVARILDAHRGIEPTLEVLPDAYAITQQGRNRTAVVVAQADMAAHVLDGWLADLNDGQPSLLQAKWWGASTPTNNGAAGIGFVTRAVSSGGAVDITVVDSTESKPASVNVGDRIIAVNGALLSMDTPGADFQRLVATSRQNVSGEDAKVTLRLIRNGMIVEVAHRLVAAKAAPLQVDPGNLIRDIAALARSVRFASYTSFVTPPGQYAGQLTLRFGAAPKP